MSLVWGQIRILVKKDFWIIRRHKRAMIWEFLLPILMAFLTVVFLKVVPNGIVGMRADDWKDTSNQGWCNLAQRFYSAPLDARQMFPEENPCYDDEISWRTYNNSDDLYAGFLKDYYADQADEHFTGNSWMVDYLAYEANQSALKLMYYGKMKISQGLLGQGDYVFSFFANDTTVTQNILYTSGEAINFLGLFATIAAIYLLIAYIPLFTAVSGRMVDEKRAKVREHLHVMGVSSFSYLFSGYGSCGLRITMVTLIICLIQVVMGSASLKTIASMFLVLELFGFSAYSFSTILPCFFSQAQYSQNVVSAFISLLALASTFATKLPAAAQIILGVLFSPIAAMFGLAPVLAEHTITLPMPWWASLLALAFHTVFYFLLGQYLYCINPGDYGVPLSPLFPFHWLAQCCRSKDRRVATTSSTHPIELKELTKVYGSNHDAPAVNKLTLHMRQGEIFALLGLNGAGKTTCISVLTGMLNATSYTEATVLGYDIGSHMDRIRESISCCPQFDVLFDDLSAIQHLEIFARVKGLTPEHAKEILSSLDLPHTTQKSSTFSGGMKRRLSVACALVGDAQVLFLDEPSSGLDPLSRRKLWKVIKDERDKGKTVVLTTHLMEEADYLGDRIGIMTHGELYCCDTSTALKEQYGVGYYLRLAKVTEAEHEGSEHRDPFNGTLLNKIVHQHCPKAELQGDSLGDATYLLPIEDLPRYGPLLKDIENNLQSIGATSYGVAMNTLEDVFITIAERDAAATAAARGAKATSGPEVPVPADTVKLPRGVAVDDEFEAATVGSAFRRFLSHSWTMMFTKKRVLRHSTRLLVLGIGFPAIIIAVGFATLVANVMGPQYGMYVAPPTPTTLPHLNNLKVPYTIPDGNDALCPDVDRVLTEVAALYPSMIKGLDPSLVNPSISFHLFSERLMGMQAYADPRQLYFGAEGDMALGLVFLTAAVLPESIKKCGLDTQTVNATYIYNDHKYSPAFFTVFDILFRAALERSAGNAIDPPQYSAASFLVPENNATTTPPKTLPTVAPETVESFEIAPLSVFVIIAIGSFVGNCALLVADELNRKITHTLRMHGLSAAAYWCGTLLFDLLLSLILVAVFVAGVYVRGVKQIQNEFLICAVIVLILFSLNTLLIGYGLLTILPENLKPSTYIAAITGFVMFTAFVPVIKYAIWNKPPVWSGCVFPGSAVFTLFSLDQEVQKHAFSQPETKYIFASVVGWNILPIGVLIWHSYFRGRTAAKGATPRGSEEAIPLIDAETPQPGSDIDVDVAAEASRVAAHIHEYMATTLHLGKIFEGIADSKAKGCCKPKISKEAVKSLTFGIRKGECFGLLGPNGAGKTTTVKMMLQEIFPTRGEIGFPFTTVPQGCPCCGRLDTEYRAFRLGVCQQHSTLWEQLSATDHMEVYLRIRLGSRYCYEDWKPYIQAAIEKVSLADSSQKLVSAMSGGMKRKLAVCIAMYTGARCVFLDEPSTGMDPYARRALWKSINEALQQDRCVLLTTHSMEEADAVCARIAIVTSGQMQCIGSSQHLKDKYGSGYSITVHLSPKVAEAIAPSKSSVQVAAYTPTEGSGDDDVPMEESNPALDAYGKEIDTAMRKMFGRECELKEVIGLTRRYAIPRLESLAGAFENLAQLAKDNHLVNYSVNQVTSLEQIFISFAGSSVLDE